MVALETISEKIKRRPIDNDDNDDDDDDDDEDKDERRFENDWKSLMQQNSKQLKNCENELWSFIFVAESEGQMLKSQ